MSSFPIAILEIENPDNKHTLTVKWFYTIKDIKDLLHPIINTHVKHMQLFNPSSVISLKNNQTLHDLGIDSSGHSLIVSVSRSSKFNKLTSATDVSTNSDCIALINSVQLGLQRNQIPKKTDFLDSTGGAYFMRSTNGQYCAVFKPHDEEQGMACNDKGYAGGGEIGLRANFKPGQGAIRELAAYILDVDGFCDVPVTSLVYLENPAFNYVNLSKGSGRRSPAYPKFGSLQQFIHAKDTFEEIGSSMISDFEVQKIALLDLRILNCDRNASNILAQFLPLMSTPQERDMAYKRGYRSNSVTSHESTGAESGADEHHFLDFDIEDNSLNNGSSSFHGIDGTYKLFPIDHGYCLPPKLHIEEFNWAWFNYPQISRPVHPEIKKYMLSLNIEEAIENLESHVTFSADTLFLLRLVHHLIVEGIKANLTLYDIACKVARLDEEVPSYLEKSLSEAEENAFRTIEMKSNRLRTGSNPNTPTRVLVDKSASSSSPLPSPLFSSGLSESIINPHKNVVVKGNSKGNEEIMSEGLTSREISDFDSVSSPARGGAVSESENSSDAYSPKSSTPASEFLENNQASGSKDYSVMSKQLYGKALSKSSRLSSLDMWASDPYSDTPPPPPSSPKSSNRSLVVNTCISSERKASIKLTSPSKLLKTDSFSASCDDIDTDTDADTEETSKTEKMANKSLKPNNKSLSIVRVASFAGFDSASLYEINDDKERRYIKLLKQRRRNIVNTSEWNRLRVQFAKKQINVMITKVSRSKM